jgi:hypothetical protein
MWGDRTVDRELKALFVGRWALASVDTSKLVDARVQRGAELVKHFTEFKSDLTRDGLRVYMEDLPEPLGIYMEPNIKRLFFGVRVPGGY